VLLSEPRVVLTRVLQTMILLDYHNRIVKQTIEARIELAGSDKKEVLDVTLADFDGVQMHITTDANDKNLLTVSLAWRCAKDLLKNGGQEYLQSVYGTLLSAQPETSYDVSLSIDLNQEAPANLARDVSLFKRHIFAGPFKKVFDAVEGGKNTNPIYIEYRDSESVFIKPEGDRVIVVFSILFKDADDQVIAKTFLQEFSDARRTLNSVPSVSFTQKDPPLELKGVKGVKADAKMGFVSFVLFKPHFEVKNREKTINNIQTFRNYLMYHIKCSKAYMHDRMRKRVESLLQVLNRARAEPLEPKEKKTITGKSFKQPTLAGKTTPGGPRPAPAVPKR